MSRMRRDYWRGAQAGISSRATRSVDQPEAQAHGGGGHTDIRAANGETAATLCGNVDGTCWATRATRPKSPVTPGGEHLHAASERACFQRCASIGMLLRTRRWHRLLYGNLHCNGYEDAPGDTRQ